ncbi:MAG TPA: hypothetical protein VFA12_01405 [Stellaceae bacterium]|nr:hypothetical protein [Stellaceae bacterium]
MDEKRLFRVGSACSGRKSVVGSAFAAFGAILLAGCHQPGLPPPPPQTAHAIQWSAPPTAPRKVARPKPKPPAPPSREAGEATPEHAAPAPSAPTEPQIASAPAPAPEDLIGLDQQAITGLLGPASEIAQRAPGAVWHYKAENCELDLSFYMELRSGSMRALQYKLKNGAGGMPPDACVRAIIAGNHKEERS